MNHIHDNPLVAGLSFLNGFSAHLKPENDYWLAIITDMPSIAVRESTPEAALRWLMKVWWELKSSYKAEGLYPTTSDPRLMWLC